MILVLALALSACTSNDKGDVDNGLVKDQVEEPIVEENNEAELGLEDTGNEQGMKMPPFKLKNIDGEEISSDIFGDYDLTIINIWQSTWPPCIEELQALKVIYDEYKDQGVNVLGIVVDDVETFGDEGVRKVIEVLELDFPNVIADYDYMYELIQFIRSTPSTIVVDENGEFLMSPILGSMGKDKDIENFRNIIDGYKN